MSAVYLTTEDNPFDPVDEFDEWFAFDEQMGYHTSSYVARIARTSQSLGDSDNEEALAEAIDEILKFNVTGNYKKIVKD